MKVDNLGMITADTYLAHPYTPFAVLSNLHRLNQLILTINYL